MARDRTVRFLKGAALAAPVLLGLLTFSAWLAWKDVDLVRMAIRRAEPRLPFKIESLEFRWNWRDLRSLSRWHVPSMDAVLHWGRWRIRLGGPLDFTREKEGGLAATYAPRATIEPDATIQGAPVVASRPVDIELAVRLTREMTELEALQAEASAPVFDFRFLDGVAPELHGLELPKGARVSAGWARGGTARVEARIPDVSLNLSPSRMARLEGLVVRGQSLVTLQPPSIAPTIPFSLEARSGEALWDELYLDLPLAKLPVSGDLRILPRFRGQARVAGVSLSAESLPPVRGESDWKLEWSTDALSIPELVRAVLKATESSGGAARALAFLRDWEIKRGQLTTRGHARLREMAAGRLPEASLRVRDLAWNWPGQRLAFGGVGVEARTRAVTPGTAGAAQARISAETVRYRRLGARLRETELKLGGGALALGDGGLGLELVDAEGMSIAVPRARARLTGPEKRLELEAAASLAGGRLETAVRKLCLSRAPMPPVSFKATFPSIEITGGDVDLPDARVSAEAFEGVIVAEDLAAFDLDAAVPELDFTLDFGGIRLDKLGDWGGFGEMDGVLAGHAHDVVFQAWLPTQFDFHLEARPLHRSKIVFSPDAMKNVVRLFAGEDIEHLPGVANWLAFGWPSRVFGGYDVRYAGVSLFSRDGSILLETLDPPEVVKSEGGKHFFLYGPRFKMPLNSSRYPLVVDAPAMANLVQQMLAEIRTLAEQKAAEKKEKTSDAPSGAPSDDRKHDDPLSDPDCLPHV